MIGLSNKKVLLVEHSDDWMHYYEVEAHKLKKLLKGCYVSIQHIGSTSILNLWAKPIIDIAIGVSSEKMMVKVKNLLILHGYNYCKNSGDIDRLFFAKGGAENRTHNIHVDIFEGRSWHNHIDFRDFMNNNPEYVKLYSELKKNLAIKYKDDRIKYTEAKDDFIQGVLKKVTKTDLSTAISK